MTRDDRGHDDDNDDWWHDAGDDGGECVDLSPVVWHQDE